MPAPDSTLQAIENKVRRLTRSPSTAQLTVADLENYINTFVVYDFPEHLRTFQLRTTFSFYTTPYQDVYRTDKASYGDPVANPTIVNNPLYNFQNNYLTVHPPIYIAGYQSLFTQSPEQFYGIYPQVNSIAQTGNVGDGLNITFTGVINSQQAIIPNSFNQQIGIVQGQVLFDSVDPNLIGLTLVDVPLINPSTGNNTIYGNLYDPNSTDYQNALITPPTYPANLNPINTINYATGSYTITFTNTPAAGAPINSQTIQQNLQLPQAVMYYANSFTLRPVPDQPYKVNIEVYQRPTALLSTSQSPQLEELWQFIAIGSAIKVLQDRMDMDSVALLLPEYRSQMNLCNRRSLVQYTNERTSTIYTEQVNLTSGGWGWGSGSTQ